MVSIPAESATCAGYPLSVGRRRDCPFLVRNDKKFKETTHELSRARRFQGQVIGQLPFGRLKRRLGRLQRSIQIAAPRPCLRSLGPRRTASIDPSEEKSREYTEASPTGTSAGPGVCGEVGTGAPGAF